MDYVQELKTQEFFNLLLGEHCGRMADSAIHGKAGLD